MTGKLFINSLAANDPIYNTIRNDDDPYMIEVREFVEELWQMYCSYADYNLDQVPDFKYEVATRVPERGGARSAVNRTTEFI
jgi:hypothetical protein